MQTLRQAQSDISNTNCILQNCQAEPVEALWRTIKLTQFRRLPNIESSCKRRLWIIRKLVVDCENRFSQFVVEIIQNNRKNEAWTAGFASGTIVFAVFFFFGIVMTRIWFFLILFATVRSVFLSFATRTLSNLSIKILLWKYKNPQTENH